MTSSHTRYMAINIWSSRSKNVTFILPAEPQHEERRVYRLGFLPVPFAQLLPCSTLPRYTWTGPLLSPKPRGITYSSIRSWTRCYRCMFPDLRKPAESGLAQRHTHQHNNQAATRKKSQRYIPVIYIKYYAICHTYIYNIMAIPAWPQLSGGAIPVV